ncbi:MAG: signal recognition particle protein [Fibrobacterota bacterium]|nr:MAG: signal recognition particle protein [Fibrobacterota bacterium]
MFEQLSRRLEEAMKKLRGEARLTDENVADSLRDVRRALLEADVELDVAKSFVAKVKERALGQSVTLSVTPGEHMINVLHDALVETLGGEAAEPNFPGNPTLVMMVGLQGSGKTTSAAKLANHLKEKRARRPMLVACDVYRPAAVNQLQVLGQKIGVPVHAEPGEKDVLGIAKRGRQAARDAACDLVIFDTAGRLQIDELLMDELLKLKKELQPQEIVFVADAMTGQEAVRVAKTFHEKLSISGAILTKTDGDARGGAALSLREATQARLLYVGTGEGIAAFEVFDPQRMAGRILGMGDVVGLVERAQERLDQGEVERLGKRMFKNQFDLEDMLAQIRQVRKLGSVMDIVGMLPGAGKLKEKAGEIDEKAIVRVEAVISSMTKQERKSPKIIDGKRRARIAKGSGTDLQQVNQVLKQYDQMKQMMQQFSKMGGKMKQMQKLMGARGKGGGMGGFPGMPGF